MERFAGVGCLTECTFRRCRVIMVAHWVLRFGLTIRVLVWSGIRIPGSPPFAGPVSPMQKLKGIFSAAARTSNFIVRRISLVSRWTGLPEARFWVGFRVGWSTGHALWGIAAFSPLLIVPE